MVYRLGVGESKNKKAVGCLFVFLCALNGPLLWGMPDADERVQYIRITGQREKPPEAVDRVHSETRKHHEAIQGTFRDIAERYFSQSKAGSSGAAASSSQSDGPKSKLFNVACFRVVATYSDDERASLGDFTDPQTLPLFISGWKTDVRGKMTEKLRAHLEKTFSSLKAVGDFYTQPGASEPQSMSSYAGQTGQFLEVDPLQWWIVAETGSKRALGQSFQGTPFADLFDKMKAMHKEPRDDRFVDAMFTFESNARTMHYFGQSADTLFEKKTFSSQFFDSEQAIRLFIVRSCDEYTDKRILDPLEKTIETLRNAQETLESQLKAIEEYNKDVAVQMRERFQKVVDSQEEKRRQYTAMLDWRRLVPSGKTFSDLKGLTLEIATLGDMCQTCQGTYWYDVVEKRTIEHSILEALFGEKRGEKNNTYEFSVLVSSSSRMLKSRKRVANSLYVLTNQE